jgi:hypothetical protein
LVLFPEAANFNLEVPLEGFLLVLQILELENQDRLFSFRVGDLSLQLGFKIFDLLSFNIKFSLDIFFFCQQPLTLFSDLTLHLLTVSLNPLVISLHRAFKLLGQVLSLLLCEMDFLNFQGTFPFKVNLLLSQLILALVQFGFQFIKPSSEISLLFHELLSLGCEIFNLRLQLLSQRLSLIFKSSISALLPCVLLRKQFNLLV